MMAVVLYGSLVDKLRGSIGGVTFSSAGGVEVVKGKSLQRLPRRPLQLPAKWSMQKYSPGWRVLSGATRAAWGTYAATVTFVNSLGQNYQINGFQMYVRNSLFEALRGAEGAATKPTANGLPSVPTVTLEWNDPNLDVSAIAPAVPSGAMIRGTVFVPTSATRNAPTGYIFGNFEFQVGGVPGTIAPDYPVGYTFLGVINAWVSWRYRDANFRVSNEVMQFLEIAL
jgi:hypothetical protein